MPNPSANFWVSQADSDLHGANRLYDVADHRTYCQTLAKYQQTVEKSIKAIAAAITDVGIPAVDSAHYYRHNVDKLISVLQRLPKPQDNREIQGHVDKVMNDYYRSEIKALSELAPKRPAPGALHARNTEYPYEIAPGVWTAPALLGSFNEHEVERFKQLAEHVYQGTRQVVSALRRQ